MSINEYEWRSTLEVRERRNHKWLPSSPRVLPSPCRSPFAPCRSSPPLLFFLPSPPRPYSTIFPRTPSHLLPFIPLHLFPAQKFFCAHWQVLMVVYRQKPPCMAGASSGWGEGGEREHPCLQWLLTREPVLIIHSFLPEILIWCPLCDCVKKLQLWRFYTLIWVRKVERPLRV